MADTSNPKQLDWATAARPCFGERVSGDVVVTDDQTGRFFGAVVDVLGHGPEAHEEALTFEREIIERWDADLAHMLSGLNTAVAGGRGAAVTLCCLDRDTGVLRTVSVGNTTLRLLGPDLSTRAVATDGVVGQRYRTPTVQQFTLAADSVALVHSDGISSTFTIDDYPQVRYQSAQAIARTVLRRFSRSYDDASCLVLRYAK